MLTSTGPAYGGGVADWVNRRATEQAKVFDDAADLAVEPAALLRTQSSMLSFAGARAGAARDAATGTAARLAIGAAVDLERSAHSERAGDVAPLGQLDRVALELWLGVPTLARLDASIGPELFWSDHGSAILRIGGSARAHWEGRHAMAAFDVAAADLGLRWIERSFFEATARVRPRVQFGDPVSGAELVAGAGARWFVAPLWLDAEWLTSVTETRVGAARTWNATLCSFLGGPSLCTSASESRSLAEPGRSVVRVELRVGVGAFLADSR